jgi:hypothetical protein
MDDEGEAMSRVFAVAIVALVTSAHVGSPDVFFQGKAGSYDIRVVVRPPEVVPGIARVTVRAPADVQRVAIRPVYWRAGSKGAPSADETSRLEGESGGGTFVGSLWLMARGAYSVDVVVDGPRGTANVLIPVASVATGQLEMGTSLAALLVALGVLLVAGLVTIVYKAAGESLVEPAAVIDPARRRRARRVAATAVPIIALGVLGGARWWNDVDREYERTLYRPSPLAVSREGSRLRVQATDTLWQPPGRPSAIVPDHGKLMHLFVVRADDAGAFAHLHPRAQDTSANPAFVATLPPLPPGRYYLYGDVVHETGFERTLVGSLEIPPAATSRAAMADPDDAWFVGRGSSDGVARLEDGSRMTVRLSPAGSPRAGVDLTIRVSVSDASGEPARLDPYLGMPAHGVVTRVDGAVYVHLHPMGTITRAAQDAFLARDRGDTTASGQLRNMDSRDHGAHATDASTDVDAATVIEFPYAFPRAGDYRLFVQVKRAGRILTGAFAIAVSDPAPDRR